MGLQFVNTPSDIQMPELVNTRGYWNHQSQQVQTPNAAAGANTLAGSDVPNGYIWVVQQIAAIDSNNAPTGIELLLYSGSFNFVLVENKAPAANTWVTWDGAVVIPATWSVRAYMTGVTLNDSITLRYIAVEIPVQPE